MSTASLQRDPGVIAAGASVTVVDVWGGGIALVKAGAAITRGHYVKVHATNGKAQGEAALAAGDFAVGIALEAAGDADEIIEVKLSPVEA